METVTHNGRRTAYRYRDNGEGPPLVYVHGSGASHRVWVEQYASSGGSPAVAVDLSGHGASEDIEADPGYETLDAYADDVTAVADRVWNRDDPRVLVGNSMGGAVVLWVALERDLRLDALVLTGTGAKLSVADELLDALDNDIDRAMETLHAPNMLFHEAAEGLNQRSIDMLRSTGREVIRRDFYTCNRYDVRGRLDEITVPALAITGEYDLLTPPVFHEYLAEEIADGKYAVIADAAHLSFLERPGAWNQHVGQFVDSL